MQALLDQQENRTAFAARDRGGSSRPADKDDRGGGEDGAAAAVPGRAARSEKAGRGAPCTPPAREEPVVKKVYSACSNVGGGGRGRRAFAEFSSYVVRKAPPLERRVECTLEELCTGCSKEVRYTRGVVTKNG
jgi:DnaJ family protein B protein 13